MHSKGPLREKVSPTLRARRDGPCRGGSYETVRSYHPLQVPLARKCFACPHEDRDGKRLLDDSGTGTSSVLRVLVVVDAGP